MNSCEVGTGAIYSLLVAVAVADEQSLRTSFHVVFILSIWRVNLQCCGWVVAEFVASNCQILGETKMLSYLRI